MVYRLIRPAPDTHRIASETACYNDGLGSKRFPRLQGYSVNLLAKIFGTKLERDLKQMAPQVEAANALEPEMQQRTDSELRARYEKIREQVQTHLAPIYEEERKALEEPSDDPRAQQNRRDALRKQRRVQEQQVLDAALPEVFAIVREVGRRHVAMR